MPGPTTFVRQLLNPLLPGTVVALIAKSIRERMEYVKTSVETGRLKPVIDRVFPAADAQAHNYSKSGHAKGKIILTFV